MQIERDEISGAWLANQKTTAAYFGISVQAFQRWNVAPVKVEGRSKFYDVRAIQDELDAEAQAELDGDSDVGPLDRERARLAKEQADKAERENRKLIGLLIPTTKVESLLLKMSAEIKSVFDALPGRLKNKYPDLDARKVGYIESELARARNAIADIRIESDTSGGD